ncbi:hypothetical protein GFS24_10265 [Chitinophaga sp. SYP-B3965]|nr:hypothetical protein [Chitinophaga sp. SYP-B3965]
MPQAKRIVNKFGSMSGWNSITANMLGRDLEGITALKYSDEKKKENAYGGGEFPVGRGSGNYEAQCSITLYKEEIDALQQALPPGGRIQDIAPFDILVEYETSSGMILKDRIRNAEFTNRGVDVKNADGTISTEYTLIISHIEWNVL